MFRNRTSLASLFQLTTISALICLALAIIGVNAFILNKHLKSRVNDMRDDFIQQQRALIKREVMQVVDLIDEQRSNIELEAQQKVKSRTGEAYAVARHIYQSYHKTKSTEDIEQLIREALRPVRYGIDNRGYFFMTRLDGTEILFADRPQVEGSNLYDLQDSNGTFIIRDMITIARGLGEGFYEYFWSKPGAEDHNHKKVSYIKYFAPLNCFIGTGVYYEDIDQQIRKRLLKTISQVRFGSDGYIFVNSFEGDCLVSSGKVYAGQGKLWEVINKNPEKTKALFDLELKAAMNQDGDFIDYTFDKPSAPNQQFPKTSFIFGLPDLNWLIGSGVYLDDVEQGIAELEQSMSQNQYAAIQSGLFLTAGISLLMILAFQLFNRRMKKDLGSIEAEFSQIARENKLIDCDQIHYGEFIHIAESANAILKDKQNALETLQDSEERFKILSNLTFEGIVIHKDGIAVDMNESFCRMIGYQRHELLNKSVFDIIAPAYQTIVKGQMVNNIALPYEAELIRKDGTNVPVEIEAKQIEMRGENYRVAAVRDIEKRKQVERERSELEQQLRQKYKMEAVGVMAGGVAHNFNNNLAIILGNLEMAEIKKSDTDKLSEYLSNAKTAVMRARELIKNILMYSRQTQSSIGPIDPVFVIDETLRLLQSTLPATVVLDYHPLPAQGVSILADSSQIQEALLNLCNNAVHAMEETGQLTIRLDVTDLKSGDEIPAQYNCQPGSYLRIAVTDTGCGMDKNTQDRIFDPFYTTKRLNEGTGVGLSTVQGIIDQHNGMLKVSSSVGQGSTFELFFPVVDTKSGDITDEQSETPPEGHEKILLVDDEEMIIEIGSSLLNQLGYRVTATTSSAEALQLFTAEDNQFDLVMTDQTMPDMTGTELIAKLKQVDPGIRTILITGYSSKIDEPEAERLGIDAFCMKPLNLTELSKTTRQVLDQKSD